MLKVKIETYEDRASPDRTCLPERRAQTNSNLSFLSLYLGAPFGVGSEWRSAGLSHASARRYQSGTFRRRGTLLTLRYGTCRNILSENKESNEDKKKKVSRDCFEGTINSRARTCASGPSARSHGTMRWLAIDTSAHGGALSLVARPWQFPLQIIPSRWILGKQIAQLNVLHSQLQHPRP